jgi:hypothetical protein
MRPLSPVELAVAFALCGSVLTVCVPTFVRNLHASRLAEPLEGLQRLSGRAAQLADTSAQASAYPDSAPLTPERVPRGEPAQDPPGTWDHPTWRLLGFAFTVPHSYGFEFESTNGPQVSSYVARARGDLDGDGVLSTFEVKGSITLGGNPQTSALEVMREVE